MTSILEQVKELDAIQIGYSILIILAVMIVSNIILRFMHKRFNKMIKEAEKIEDKEKRKHRITTINIINDVARFAIYVLVVLVILNSIGLGGTVNNLLLTAGIGSLVISLGAQSLIQDIVAGITLTFEGQFQVGDRVLINGYKGNVWSFTLRSTAISCLDGSKVFIPNGQITSVVNFSTKFSRILIEIPVSYETDIKTVRKVLEKICLEFNEKNKEDIYEPLAYKAVTEYQDTYYVVSLYGMALPLKNWQFEIDLREEILKEFHVKGLKLGGNREITLKNKQ